jgi:CHAT domain-containing protein
VWSERAHTPRLGVADDGPGERRRPQLTAASVARLQRGLADGEFVVEYFVGRAAVHRFVVSRGRIVHARLAAAPAALRERVFALRRLWDRFTLDARGGARRRAALQESERELLAGLHDDLLVGAIEEGALRVTIVPHSWLRDVPFHALGRDTPLAAGPRVDYLLSARERLRPQRTPRRPSSGGVPLVVGVASPQAPSAEREARAVAACHPDARVLFGDDATPDAVRAAWSSASLIHVATHASRDLDEPRRSGVQLGAGSWTAFDVAREGMAADLVVLSGCRTGDAVVWGGDEAFGLLPALREAGDAAVLVSLWAVEDGAADAWMQRFHGALAAGTPAAAAWQVAVAESRSRADSAYHWAPFALYGQRWSQGR